MKKLSSEYVPPINKLRILYRAMPSEIEFRTLQRAEKEELQALCVLILLLNALSST